MLQACAVHLHHSHRVIIVVIFFNVISSVLFSVFSLYQLWQRKLRLSSEIRTCFLSYFGMLNLWHKFWLSSQRTSHPISIPLQLWHTELYSTYHLLFNNVSFQPYVLEVHLPFLDSFFTFSSYTSFPFSSADLERCLPNSSSYFSRCYGKWCSLCWGLSSHTRHFLIYWVQTIVITDEALQHT
jgi:hypothetical protein